MVLLKLLVIHQRRILTQLFRDLGMSVHEAVHVRQLTTGYVAIAASLILALVKALLLPHEGVRIFLIFLAHSRMLRQELLQRRMVLLKLLVIHQRRILTQLFSDLGVAVHESVHVRQLTTGYVAIAASLILALVKALLLPHEGVRIFLIFLAHSRMLRQELLQRRMVLLKLLVIHQRRILTQLFSDLGVAVHESVHVRQLTTGYVAIAARLILALVKALLLPHEGVRIFLIFLAHSRMLRQELLQRRMVLLKLLVIHQRRILTQLFSDLGVAVHESVHVRQLTTGYVAIAASLILALVKALLLPHEGVRIFLIFLAHSRMLRQELLQRRMVLLKLLVIHQRWILTQLFSDLGVSIHEAVHVRQLTTGYVAIAASLILALVKALLLVHEGVRIFFIFLAHSRMLRQELL